jgi:branched-chain amino acid transport system substrate-binding protein
VLSRRTLLASAATSLAAPVVARAQPVPTFRLPILLPLTGFAALEGKSQREGALLAIRDVASTVRFVPEVLDTGTAPEAAVTAWQRAMRDGARDGARAPVAVLGPILGTQMLALLPEAASAKLPLLAVSGTARLSELGNPFFFRFFPADTVVKIAHARYVAQVAKAKKPAVIYQTTAYGQSGHAVLAKAFADAGITMVLEEGVATSINDFTPIVAKAKAAGADALVLHLHSQSTALAIRAARAVAPDLPIVAGSAMAQPATAALFQPAELKGVCSETASMPAASMDEPRMRAFVEAYRAEYKADPDAFATAEYDAVSMLAVAVAEIARTSGVDKVSGETVRAKLSALSHRGLATTYRSDGKGNMVHAAIIVCYDGSSRVPAIAQRYSLP